MMGYKRLKKMDDSVDKCLTNALLYQLSYIGTLAKV